ncbi:MAG: response regulator [Candidatus Latescibacteria bacterium]|nr:response regulator [Candidatus Latescibacterota bacterium]
MNGANEDLDKPLKIMVVDDEENIREVLESFLESEGYDVISAESGAGALSALEYDEPHIVLLDIRMPDIDGIQCLRRLKEVNEDIQVVMMSGFATLQMAQKSLEIGAFDYIRKPLSFVHLKEVIQQIRITKFLEMM